MLSISPNQTRALAANLIEDIGHNAVIALHGNLGAGKTCFVQGIAQALKISGVITSPTFTIVNEYKGLAPLYHIDLYRLSKDPGLFALEFDEYIELYGIKAIEWPEHAGNMLPENTVNVFLEPGDNPDERRIRIIRK